jgi:N-acetylglutamate synthase/N-acetylornithine aminotransferase
MQEKLAQKQQQQQAQQQQQQEAQQQKTHHPAVFSTGETVERTPVDAIPSLIQNQNKKKHKKNKSKK